MTRTRNSKSLEHQQVKSLARAFLLLAVFACLTSAEPLVAGKPVGKGGGKGGGGGTCVQFRDGVDDKVQSDGAGAYCPGAGEGSAIIRKNLELKIDTPLRHIFVDFGQQYTLQMAPTTNPVTFATTDELLNHPEIAWVQFRFWAGWAESNEKRGFDMSKMAVGEQQVVDAQIKIKLGYSDGSESHLIIGFDPDFNSRGILVGRVHPDWNSTDWATVTRLDSNTWMVDISPGDQAILMEILDPVDGANVVYSHGLIDASPFSANAWK